jgi:hypothetical protein
VLQAMQSLIISEALVGGGSPFATLSAADQTRYGVARAVFVGRPKEFKDGYLPQCCLWVPERDEGHQPVELAGYAGRVMDLLDVTVQAFVDMRSDWWAGEQKILQIRDALWPVVLKHLRLNGAVAGVIESHARQARGFCYEEVAGTEYRCYELVWSARSQWTLAGGKAV